MKYRMSEGMTNIGTPLKEAMERTPRPKELDGSLINEGTKEPEKEPVGYQQLFNAISAAVKTPYEGAVVISVSAFEKALGSRIYTAPPQLKEPEQEPVANQYISVAIPVLEKLGINKTVIDTIATTPPHRTWVGLTQEEQLHFLNEILDYGTGFVSPFYAVICNIEAKLKQKNT